MARPNVTVLVNDDSFIISGSEAGSITRGGMPSYHGLVATLGNTAEKERGVIEVDSVGLWIDKLLVAGFTGGPAGSWIGEWWAVHNFLQYGGVAVVGGTGSVDNTTISSTSSALHSNQIPLDVLFVGANSDGSHVSAEGVSTVINVASTRQDCVAVVPTGMTSAVATYSTKLFYAFDTSDDAQTVAFPSDEYTIPVFGFKKHFNLFRNNDTSSSLVTTNVSPDVAGCIARTDRTDAPWISPAGFTRGQILDVIRMTHSPTNSQLDTLYDNEVNPVITFSGEGTVLFGDKTTATDTSTFSRINVVRLFIYLKKTVGAAARRFLFEINDDVTRSSFVNTVVPFLDNIKSRRGLYDFRVICDETNNTASIIDSNQFIADIYLKPTKSINFIKLTFTNKNTSADLG